MTAELAPELARAIDRRSVEQAYAFLRSVPEKDRKAAFPLVVEYVKEPLADWRGGYAAVAGLALLGCAPTAKRAMAAISRGSLRWERWRIPLRETLDLLAERDVPWLGELARLWAERSGLSRADEWLLVDGIAGLARIEMPRTEGYARGWVDWVRSAKDGYEAITTGAYARHLLPLLFEHDGLDGCLEDAPFRGSPFRPLLHRLAAEQPDLRVLLLDGCLARLVRGGRPGGLRVYVTLLDELAPAPEETAQRVADFVALAGAELSTAAGLAQKCLRQADRAGLTDVGTLLDVSGVLLRRKEKGLVKTQTTWVRQAAARHPDRAAELLGLLDRPAEPELTAETAAVPAVPLMPPPITDPAELAEVLVTLLRGDETVATWERVLAALVELSGQDREALAAVVRPVIAHSYERLFHSWVARPVQVLGSVLNGLLEPPPRRQMRLMEAFGELRADHAIARPLREDDRSPAALLEMRIATMDRYLPRTPVPRLVSTPTLANGLLDPAELVDRIERAERDGWQPWHADLIQALLRLPRDGAGTDVRHRAERLTSPAGQQVAQRIRDGHRDPVVTAYAQHGSGRQYRWFAPLPDRRLTVTLAPPDDADPVESALFRLARHECPQTGGAFPEPMWTGLLPAHREVVAAWTLTHLAVAADSRGGVGGTTGMLPLLAECEGPTGPATQLALVYGMTVPAAADRIATVDALLAFADAVDWSAVGAYLGDCVTAGSLVLSRAVTTLRDAAEAGAVCTAWQISEAALPFLLAEAKPRTGAADLLRLADKCARSLGRRAHIAGLERAAARGGGSQFAAAARQLHATVAPLP